MKPWRHLVRSDKIDILVDLTGHIGDNRLLVFARKPAPLQVTYLGYQNTTGMSAIDAPADRRAFRPAGTNRPLVHGKPGPIARDFFLLPAAGRRARSQRATGDRKRRDHVRLAQPHQQVDDRGIWDLGGNPAGGSQLPAASVGLRAGRARAKTQGDRRGGRGRSRAGDVVINRVPRADYFRLHGAIDIALDTFPFNGHTTVCDALWMGVPSVVMEGDRYAARFGGSALVQLGLNDWIARSGREYVDVAVAQAGDLTRLAELRRSLRQRMLAEPFMDAVGFTRKLESVYRQLWRKKCESDSTDVKRVDHPATERAASSESELQPDAAELAEGMQHYERREWTSAATCFRRAIAQVPESAEAHFNLGLALAEMGRWPEAARSYRESVRHDPASVRGWINLADSHLRCFQPDEAAAAARQAVGLDPQSALAWAKLFNCLRSQGDMDGRWRPCAAPSSSIRATW